MSEFKVTMETVEIFPHGNADLLEIAKIKGYQCVVPKGKFKSGDTVFYIPESSLVPRDIQAALGVEGKLSGPCGNRVKAHKFRGVLSQGLVLTTDYLAGAPLIPGYDYSGELNIEKFEPIIPAALAGNVWAAGAERTVRYDIENFKKYPDVFSNNEEVVFTEKIHGTWCCIGVLPDRLKDEEYGDVIITSKGNSGKGLALKPRVEPTEQNLLQKLIEPLLVARFKFMVLYAKLLKYMDWSTFEISQKISKAKEAIRNNKNLGVNCNNTYCLVEKELDLANKIRENFSFEIGVQERPVFVLGEVFGKGVQDLGYGTSKEQFRVFDIAIGQAKDPSLNFKYLNDEELEAAVEKLGLQRVPVLYRGIFSVDKMNEFTNGKETISGTGSHVREGIVIRTVKESYHPDLGRMQLKSVSEKYLLRKGNTTEYT